MYWNIEVIIVASQNSQKGLPWEYFFENVLNFIIDPVAHMDCSTLGGKIKKRGEQKFDRLKALWLKKY